MNAKVSNHFIKTAPPSEAHLAGIMRLTLDTKTGLVNEARQVNSPNFDERPAGCVPELIVVHNIALPPDEFGGPWIDKLFCNCLDPAEHQYFEEIHELKVSAHFLIRRDAELVQYVPITRRAWHAGQSCFEGRAACNDYSLGIELEGTDTTLYTYAQYTALAALISALRHSCESLANAPIVGHSDIAPERKTDPGEAFDWNHLNRLLGHSSSA